MLLEQLVEALRVRLLNVGGRGVELGQRALADPLRELAGDGAVDLVELGARDLGDDVVADELIPGVVAHHRGVGRHLLVGRRVQGGVPGVPRGAAAARQRLVVAGLAGAGRVGERVGLRDVVVLHDAVEERLERLCALVLQ